MFATGVEGVSPKGIAMCLPKRGVEELDGTWEEGTGKQKGVAAKHLDNLENTRNA